MKKKLLITGANGYIGSKICEYFSKQFIILVISRSKPKLNCFWCKFHDANPESYERFFKKHNPDFIIHTAAIAHKKEIFISQKIIKNIKTINFEYTKALATLSNKYQIKRFIYLSSISIYKDNKNTIIENSEISPNNLYATTKYESEKEIIKFFKKSKTCFTIFRLPLIYGIDAPGNIHKLIKLVDMEIPLPFFNFIKERSLLSINNLISAIDISFKKKATFNKIYLLSDEEKISTSKIVKLIAKARNKKLILYSLPKFFIYFLYIFPIIGYNLSKLYNGIIIDNNLFKKDANWSPPFSQKKEMIKSFKYTK